MITLMEILSDNPIENVITCMRFKVDRVVFFGPLNLIDRYYATSSRFLKDVCGVMTVECAETDPHSLNRTLSSMRTAVSSCRKEEHVFCDVTGGNDTALIAAGIVSDESSIPLHSFDVRTGALFFLKDDAPFRISEAAEKNDVSCNVDDYVRLHGGAVNYRLHKSQKGEAMIENGEDVRKLISVYKNNKSIWPAFSSFIARVTGRESHSFAAPADTVRRMLHSEFPQLGGVRNLWRILGELKNAGLLPEFRHRDGECSFAFKSAFVQEVISEAGCVLEMIAYLAERELADDCVIGCHIDWDGIIHNAGDVVNEIDVISIRNGVPCFISCKCGSLSGVSYAHALDELYLLAKRFGGKYAMKKLYVAAGLCETSASNIARAGEMGIELVEIG